MTAACRAKRAFSPAIQRGRRWPGCCSWRISSRRARRWSSCSTITAHPLSRKDVQRRVDAREGLPDTRGQNGTRPGRDKKAASLISIECTETVAEAAHLMTQHGFSQVPVIVGRTHRGVDQRDAALYGNRPQPGRKAHGPSNGSCSPRSRSPTSRPTSTRSRRC